MAVYFLNLKTFGRSGGSSAPSAAAYRAGERIKDERTGRTYDHSSRQDVMHKEIVLPSRYGDADMGWASDRANLWNAAEEAESRKNARVAREYLVALPAELSPEQRLGLAREFSQELSDRYRFAVDLTITRRGIFREAIPGIIMRTFLRPRARCPRPDWQAKPRSNSAIRTVASWG